jgi:small subunit ribosomal protein S16
LEANAKDRTARNSKPLEVLGTYNPIPQQPKDGEGRAFKDIELDLSRAKYWLGVGAQPSDSAWRLLGMVRF